MTDAERQKAAEWFIGRAKNCPMPAARQMYEIAAEALEEPKTEGVKRLTNAEWKDFLSEQFGISKSSAREMLHGMIILRNNLIGAESEDKE